MGMKVDSIEYLYTRFGVTWEASYERTKTLSKYKVSENRIDGTKIEKQIELSKKPTHYTSDYLDLDKANEIASTFNAVLKKANENHFRYSGKPCLMMASIIDHLDGLGYKVQVNFKVVSLFMLDQNRGERVAKTTGII